MSKTNQAVSLPNGGPNPIPEALQQGIDAYFRNFCGGKQIEERLYSVMETAICNEESTDAATNADHLFIYRRTKELIELLESFTSNRRAELWKN